jgi:hypothetical protein
VLTEYLRHYNSVRPHRGLDLQPPIRAGGLTLVKAPPTTKPAIQRIDVLGGPAPVTRASGKSLYVMTRKVKNQRLAAADYVWAFSAHTASPRARAHYDRRRHTNDRHAAASATCSTG